MIRHAEAEFVQRILDTDPLVLADMLRRSGTRARQLIARHARLTDLSWEAVLDLANHHQTFPSLMANPWLHAPLARRLFDWAVERTLDGTSGGESLYLLSQVAEDRAFFDSRAVLLDACRHMLETQPRSQMAHKAAGILLDHEFDLTPADARAIWEGACDNPAVHSRFAQCPSVPAELLSRLQTGGAAASTILVDLAKNPAARRIPELWDEMVASRDLNVYIHAATDAGPNALRLMLFACYERHPQVGCTLLDNLGPSAFAHVEPEWLVPILECERQDVRLRGQTYLARIHEARQAAQPVARPSLPLR